MSAIAAAWSPTSEQAQSSRLWRFMREHHCATYAELCERAAREPDWFWDALVKELGIVWSAPYDAVMDTSAGLPFTRWFPGGLLNAYDSAVLRYRLTEPDRVALIGETEAGTTRQLTYAQLQDAVEHTAAGLRAIGVGRGVAVGLYLPLGQPSGQRLRVGAGGGSGEAPELERLSPAAATLCQPQPQLQRLAVLPRSAGLHLRSPRREQPSQLRPIRHWSRPVRRVCSAE